MLLLPPPPRPPPPRLPPPRRLYHGRYRWQRAQLGGLGALYAGGRPYDKDTVFPGGCGSGDGLGGGGMATQGPEGTTEPAAAPQRAHSLGSSEADALARATRQDCQSVCHHTIQNNSALTL